MIEKAFKLKKDSKMYNEYFAAANEKKRFLSLARDFFNNHGFHEESQRYLLSECLAVTLCKEDEEKFADQIKVTVGEQGLRFFKKKSAMQKAWTEEVINNIDFKLLRFFDFWYWTCINKGHYTIWDKGGDVYGYLDDNYEVKLTDDMEEIKMSEYYKIRESFDEEVE